MLEKLLERCMNERVQLEFHHFRLNWRKSCAVVQKKNVLLVMSKRNWKKIVRV